MTANPYAAELAARHRPFTVSSDPHHTPPDAPVFHNLSSRTRPRFVGTAVRDLLFQRRNRLRGSESSIRVALTDQCMSDYSLEGWKDSTWVWEK